jgi:glycogen phosphorylase
MNPQTRTLGGNAGPYPPRSVPAALEALRELALDMRWSWNHEADALWEKVDPELWEATGNPWLILQSISVPRLEQLAQDAPFLVELQQLQESRQTYINRRSWFATVHGESPLSRVAYFSLEFGLSESLPLYAGGLGILAGDHLKTASDLGIPLVGIGLLYQQGYFRQAIGADHNQVAVYPYNNPAMLPITPVRDASREWVRVGIELPGRRLYLRAWQVTVGAIMLYLLDSNDPLNLPIDRGITGELYSGGPEMRLQQEIVLGIGGWRLLKALEIDCEVCHLNEGHAALAVIERARDFMASTGCSFEIALRCTRAGNIFTTHTPVEAGFDCFHPELVVAYFAEYVRSLGIAPQEFLALGRARSDSTELFNMAHLAVRGCSSVNAVSRLHEEVSHRILQPLFPRWPRAEVPVAHVTNGVHVPSWDSVHADEFWTESCGKGRWVGALEELEQAVCCASDAEIWTLRTKNRQALVQAIRRRTARQLSLTNGAGDVEVQLDSNVLTLGLARRFTAYKRPNLLLHDPDRLTGILCNLDRPAQLVVAGKAHPSDYEGARMVHEWVQYSLRPEVRGKVVFLEDYDIALAAELVQGVDLWINTPRRPWEACGTSGMKLLVNGGLNLSELDGWWAEAYAPDVGWALGDGQEHEADPEWDAREADDLYRILEQEVLPAFYRRDAKGIPTEWVARIRASMSRLAPHFSSNRMVREYTEGCYLPAADNYRRRAAENCTLGKKIERWLNSLRSHWPEVRFGKLEVQESGDQYVVRVQVYLGSLDLEAVAIELFADGIDGGAPVYVRMEPRERIAGGVNGRMFEAFLQKDRSVVDFTPRVVPKHPDAAIPLEANQILWSR